MTDVPSVSDPFSLIEFMEWYVETMPKNWANSIQLHKDAMAQFDKELLDPKMPDDLKEKLRTLKRNDEVTMIGLLEDKKIVDRIVQRYQKILNGSVSSVQNPHLSRE